MAILSRMKAKRSKSSDSSLQPAHYFTSSECSFTTMSMTSNSTGDSRPTSRHAHTGFPDSFASHTTSLRHPDAIVDPDFAICAEEIDPAKLLSKSKHSLLRKHRRTISSGKITEELPKFEPQQSSARRPTTDSAIGMEEKKPTNADMTPPSSRAGANSTSPAQSGSPASPGFQYSPDSRQEARKSRIFGKWKSSKD
ncbi:hypothetical protein F5Y18DRAFT_218535 [Xylariaceae sp. FL1019]|nr:hypothetical protein F5Y18DRAFT_218535 [Xylariaceae sp. FL1019]